MDELKLQEGAGIIDILHNQNSGNVPSIPMPFERDIFLFDTYVAGTSYVEGIEELEPTLEEGTYLEFKREPQNEHDRHAIRIQNKDGQKLGYVPRKDNVVFARLMDAGKLLFGRITHKEWKEEWLKIDIKVYLHE